MPRASRREDLLTVLNALADETRLRILNLIAGQEICVCYFIEALKEPQPKISRHLAYLRRSGLVNARREGKWIHYSLNWPQDAHIRSVVERALAWAAEHPAAERDRKRMETACCQPEKFLTIAAAPAPKPVGA